MRLILLPVLILFCFPVSAQNLVMNPDFETKTACPDNLGQIRLAVYWESPNPGTPDYFNDCSGNPDWGTEFNKKGGQIPHSGHAYAGLQYHNINRNEYYEYIRTELASPLETGRAYCIRAYVSLGSSSYAFREFGAVLSQTVLKSATTQRLKLPYTALSNGNVLSDTEGWMCISGIYHAKGGEKYLTFGSYAPVQNFVHINTESGDSIFMSTYYFVDDISLESLVDSIGCKCPK